MEIRYPKLSMAKVEKAQQTRIAMACTPSGHLTDRKDGARRPRTIRIIPRMAKKATGVKASTLAQEYYESQGVIPDLPGQRRGQKEREPRR